MHSVTAGQMCRTKGCRLSLHSAGPAMGECICQKRQQVPDSPLTQPEGHTSAETDAQGEDHVTIITIIMHSSQVL